MTLDDLCRYVDQAAQELEQTAADLRRGATVQAALGDRPISTLQINHELEPPLTCAACGIPIAVGEAYVTLPGAPDGQIYHRGLQQCVCLLISRLTFVLEMSYPARHPLPDVHCLGGG